MIISLFCFVLLKYSLPITPLQFFLLQAIVSFFPCLHYCCTLGECCWPCFHFSHNICFFDIVLLVRKGYRTWRGAVFHCFFSLFVCLLCFVFIVPAWQGWGLLLFFFLVCLFLFSLFAKAAGLEGGGSRLHHKSPESHNSDCLENVKRRRECDINQAGSCQSGVGNNLWPRIVGG